MEDQNLQKGDKIEIVWYGDSLVVDKEEYKSLFKGEEAFELPKYIIHETDKHWIVDVCKFLVGKVGTIAEIEELPNGERNYSLEGVLKYYPYKAKQLKLIT